MTEKIHVNTACDESLLETPQVHSHVVFKRFQWQGAGSLELALQSAHVGVSHWKAKENVGTADPITSQDHREKDIWSTPVSPGLLCCIFSENSRKLLTPSC